VIPGKTDTGSTTGGENSSFAFNWLVALRAPVTSSSSACIAGDVSAKKTAGIKKLVSI
jgi:hypothetical protein